MAAIVGEAGLPEADRRALAFAERFEQEFVSQGNTRRTLPETLDAGWRLLESLPRDDLTRVSDEAWAARGDQPRAGAA
jgi:V/A-type H+-transporting ATPase subunit B